MAATLRGVGARALLHGAIDADESRLMSRKSGGPTDLAATKAIEIRVGEAADVEPKFVSDITVNFTGDVFLVAFSQAVPPTLRRTEDIPDAIQARTMLRAAISTRRWAQALTSMKEQLEGLRVSGALPELDGG